MELNFVSFNDSEWELDKAKLQSAVDQVSEDAKCIASLCIHNSVLVYSSFTWYSGWTYLRRQNHHYSFDLWNCYLWNWNDSNSTYSTVILCMYVKALTLKLLYKIISFVDKFSGISLEQGQYKPVLM